MRFRRLGTGLKREPPSEMNRTREHGDDTDIEAWFQTALGRAICDTAYQCVSRLIPSGYYRAGFQVGLRNLDLLQRAEHVYWGGPSQGGVRVNDVNDINDVNDNDVNDNIEDIMPEGMNGILENTNIGQIAQEITQELDIENMVGDGGIESLCVS